MELQTSDQGWSISLPDSAVDQVQVDYRLGLLIATESEYIQVHIETRFRISEPGAADVWLEPNDYPTLGPALILFTKALTRIEADRRGKLTIRFEDGCVVEAEPDDAHEAWHVSARDVQLTCQPGGTVLAEEV